MTIILFIFFTCFVIINGDDVIKDGMSCDPDEFEIKPDLENRTNYLYCHNETRKVISESCPIINGHQKVFDAARHMCRFQRTRRTPGLPRSGRLSEACIYNTDCLQNLYCLSGACICIPGYVEIGEECVPTINPGQAGCAYDRQCSGAWPFTTCKSGVCMCPNDQFPADTRDGVVCVKPGKCPLPDGYLGTILDQLSTDTTCIYGDTSTTDDKACFANEHYAGDIYDCIPKTADKSPTDNGLCCPSRALTCVQPKAAVTDGSETRFWYNSITGHCETFMWNGGSGVANSNNFRTLDQCMAFCAGICTRGAAQLSKGHSIRCVTTDVRCDTTHYSCTAHNGQPRYCCPSKDFICSNHGGRLYASTQPPSGPDFGVAPITVSPVGANQVTRTMTRWFYDRKAGRCMAFDYKGLAGNFNNFLTENDCQIFCGKAKCDQGEPLKDNHGNDQECNGMYPCPSAYECRKGVCCPKSQTVCMQPKFVSTMSCGALSRQRYWFNARTRDCEEFSDGGCRGNDNNFDAYATCMAYCSNTKAVVKCVQGEADKETTGEYRKCSNAMDRCRDNFECYYDGFTHGCCPTKAYICNLQAESGRACSTSTVRWFYDATLHICRPFEYLGCDGNGNNFMNRRECDRFCGTTALSIGCPFGGGAGDDVESWRNRVCEPGMQNSCVMGFECMKLLISGHTSNYCCPTRAHVCQMDRKSGDTCSTSAPSKRYFFNAQSKECEEFMYRGCGGNENNFVTMSQCANFCYAEACGAGEIVYMDSSTREPLTCRISAPETTCPAGYLCMFSDLLRRGVCCGSNEMDVCPAGEKAYVEAVSQEPKTCRSTSSSDDCPPGFLCRQQSMNKLYCCKPAVTAYCPPGRALYRDPSTTQPQSCDTTKRSKPTCALGFTCYAQKEGQTRGFCCSNVAEVKHDMSASKICPRGYVGYKEPGRGIVRNCVNGTSGASACPLGYVCMESPLDRRGHCCGVSGGCPYPTVAYIGSKSNHPMRCRQGGVCPHGYICKPTSTGAYICCSASTFDESIDEEDAEEIEEPTSAISTSSEKPRCANDEENDGSTERRSLCDSDRSDSCPVGYECELASNVDVYICCKTTKNVCNGQTMPHLNPISRKAQSCVPGATKKCPNGYKCSYSNYYEKYYCCSTNEMCPLGYRAYLPHGDSSPRRCAVAKFEKNPCPEMHACMYSSLLRDYICCIRSNQSMDLNEIRSKCTIQCGGKSQKRCPAGFTCEDIGRGSRRCCPDKSKIAESEDGEEIEESQENDQDQDAVCDSILRDDPTDAIALRPTSIPHCRPRDAHRKCPRGRECKYLGRKRGYRCCPASENSRGTTVTATIATPVTVTGPCRTGRPYMHPTTRTPLVCGSPAGFCPMGYFCEFSAHILHYVCCPRLYSPSARYMEATQSETGATIFLPGGSHGSITGSIAQIPNQHLANLNRSLYANVNQMMPVPNTIWQSTLPPIPAVPTSTAEPIVVEKSETVVATAVLPNSEIAKSSAEPDICDLDEKKEIGQECCHEDQCGPERACKSFTGRRICRCPINLILDMTVYPFRCVSSCKLWLHDSVCTLIKQH